MNPPLVKRLGRRDYEPVWHEMRATADSGPVDAPDEIWFVEHPPVFTLGMNANRSHVLAPGDIPLVQVDRGGEVTYHGPGQLVVYPLLNLERLELGVRQLVTALEQAMIALLSDYGIDAAARADAPGVYVDGSKIGSIGLRIRRRRSYHGLALNVGMDMEPFHRINPCGFQGLTMTQVSELGGPAAVDQVADDFEPHLLQHLGYNA